MAFYDAGGGAGLGFPVPNQTLPEDRLELSDYEKKALVAFMESLNDTLTTFPAPARLPSINGTSSLLHRKTGGEY